MNEIKRPDSGLLHEWHVQIIGKMTLNGSYDYFGEYDEEMDLIEFEKAEVQDGWFDDSLGLI